MADPRGIKTDNFEKVSVESTEQLHDWLSEHHDQDESVWLVTFKKSTPKKYLSTSDVLDELLIFGWVDGIRRKLDELQTMQLISPRRSKHWSKTYKDRAARLEKEGRMQAPGRAAIERSKRSGMWNFLDDVDALIKTTDFAKALTANPPALERFDAFSPAVQRFALREIKLCKTEPTRMKKIHEIVIRAAAGQRPKGT